MKQVLTIALALILVFALAACSSVPQQADEPVEQAPQQASPAEPAEASEELPPEEKELIKIKYCVTGAETSYAGRYAQYLADLLNEEMGDVLEVDFYPNDQLGTMTEQLENLQTDLQQMYSGSFDALSQYSKDINIMTMAYAFESSEHLDAFLDSELCQGIWDDIYENVGIKLISCDLNRLPRCFVSTKPIYKKDDMKGLLWRVPDIDIYYKNIEFMGATPTFVAWAEVPYALMQGTVDACETTCEFVYSSSLHTVAPYVSICEYAYAKEAIYMNAQTWEKLSPEDQERFMECAAQAVDYYNDMVQSDWESDKASIVAEGGTIIEKTEMDIESFRSDIDAYAAELEANGVWETEGLYAYVQSLK